MFVLRSGALPSSARMIGGASGLRAKLLNREQSMQHDQRLTEPEVAPAPKGEAAPDQTQPDTLQLFAEEAHVSRRTVESGRVRIATVTHTRDHLVDELPGRTHVEVERVPIGRVIDAIAPIEGDTDHTVIPIVEETVVVERRQRRFWGIRSAPAAP